MSYNVTHTGHAKDVDARHEQLIDTEKHRQLDGPAGHLQRTALESTKAVVEAVTKHARHHESPLSVVVETFGHFNDDGTGDCTIKVGLFKTPAPEAPKAEGE